MTGELRLSFHCWSFWANRTGKRHSEKLEAQHGQDTCPTRSVLWNSRKSRKMSPEKVSSTTSPNRKVSYQLCYFLWTQRIVHYNNKELFITFATFQSLKPVMERKRRARINASLAELKSLLIEVIQAEVSVAFIPRD